MNFKDKLEIARKYRNLNIKEISNKLEIKQSAYSRFKNSNSTTDVITLTKICKTLLISSEYFLGFTSNLKEIKPTQIDNYYNIRLKEIREYEGIKIKEISNYIGITIQQYTRNEKGINTMNLEHFKLACEYLNISPDYILGLSSEKKAIYNIRRNK